MYMKNWICLLIIFGLLSGLTACAPAPTQDPSLQQSSTASMKTVNALSTQLAEKPTATRLPPTKTPIRPTKTPTITPTPFRSLTPLPTVVTPWNTCDVAAYISETISDKIVMEPGSSFVKTWTLQNSGTCIWDKDYRLVFESGEAMTDITEFQFISGNKTVEPGQQITISLDLVSPMKTGNFLGFWKLANAKGQRFGLTGAADPIWVNITVGTPTNELFRVTKVAAFTVPNSFSGACGKKGYTVTLLGRIKTNRAGTVIYKWTGTDNISSEPQELIFYGADEQEVFYTFTIMKGVHYGYAKLVILSPVEKDSEKATYSIECIR
jgi:hypothetical protein